MNKAPIFQHRHYKAIAAELSAHRDLIGLNAQCAVMVRFADMFAKDNPRFDRDRFVAASNGEPINGRDCVGQFAAGLMAATNGKVRS